MKSVSNNEAVTRLPPKRRMTQEQIASIAARHHLTKHSDIALRRERPAIKARAERKFRFYILFDFVTEYETLLCAWEHVKASGKKRPLGIPTIKDRVVRFLNRKSQRRYRLKFADTYYGELNHYGMYWLKWADVRR